MNKKKSGMFVSVLCKPCFNFQRMPVIDQNKNGEMINFTNIEANRCLPF